jgi:hypothetical protein
MGILSEKIDESTEVLELWGNSKDQHDDLVDISKLVDEFLIIYYYYVNPAK